MRFNLGGGSMADVACNKPYDASQAFYAADIARVLNALQLPPAP